MKIQKISGAPTGQHVLSPGQRPEFLIVPHSSAPTGQKPYNQLFMSLPCDCFIYEYSAKNSLIRDKKDRTITPRAPENSTIRDQK